MSSRPDRDQTRPDLGGVGADLLGGIAGREVRADRDAGRVARVRLHRERRLGVRPLGVEDARRASAVEGYASPKSPWSARHTVIAAIPPPVSAASEIASSSAALAAGGAVGGDEDYAHATIVLVRTGCVHRCRRSTRLRESRSGYGAKD